MQNVHFEKTHVQYFKHKYFFTMFNTFKFSIT